MIRINLLPVRAAKRQELGKKQVFLFALLLAGAFIGNSYWTADRSSANGQLVKQVTALRKEIQDLERTIGEVKNIAKEKQALEDKLKVLITLKKSRSGPVKMLDALATAIPKNVWLKSMKEDGKGMLIEGTAMSHDDLAEFMKAVESVVWTPEGMGRLVEAMRKGVATVRVEMTLTGQTKDIAVDKLGFFFKDISLKRANQRSVGGDMKVVEFSLTCSSTYAI